MVKIKYEPTNVILFPRMRVPVRTLVDYWLERGYRIGVTRLSNLRLERIVRAE